MSLKGEWVLKVSQLRATLMVAVSDNEEDGRIEEARVLSLFATNLLEGPDFESVTNFVKRVTEARGLLNRPQGQVQRSPQKGAAPKKSATKARSPRRK